MRVKWVVVGLVLIIGLAAVYALGWLSPSSGKVRLPMGVETVRTIRGHECHFMYQSPFVVVMSTGALIPATLKQGDTGTITGWDVVDGQITNVWHIDFTWTSVDSSGYAVVRYDYGRGLSLMGSV